MGWDVLGHLSPFIIQPGIIYIFVVICNSAYIELQLLEIKWTEMSKEICGFNAVIVDCINITIYLIDYIVFSAVGML